MRPLLAAFFRSAHFKSSPNCEHCPGKSRFYTSDRGQVMSFKTKCTNCQAPYTLKSRDAEGKKIKCKKCGETFVVRFAKKKAPAAGDDSEWDAPAAPPMAGLPPVVGGAKKKKKKPSDEEDAPKKSKKASTKQKNILIVVGLLAALGIFTGVIFAVGGLGGGGGGNKPLQQATYQFKRGSSGQSLFSIDYPAQWKFARGGGSGGKPEWITLESEADGINVSIRENVKASAMGDIAGAATRSTEELPPELKPIAKVHEQLKNDMKLSFDNYKEDAPEVVTCGLGEGRLSKFSGDEGAVLSSMVYGYRGTFPSGPEMVKVLFKFSSEKQFKRHEDVIRKMIASLGR